MVTALSRLPGNAFELTVTLPWPEVKKIYDEVFAQLAAQIEIEGFRKGNAPRAVVESKIDKAKVYGEVINKIVPESYRKALAEHNLKPVIAPQVKITQADEDKDWQLLIQAAEQPKVELNDYKKEVAAINTRGKIWVPGQGQQPIANNQQPTTDQEDDKQKEQKRISEIIEKLLAVCQVELAQILVETETNRLLTQLVEDVRQAGLTYEQYLASSSQTGDGVKAKYQKLAETTLKLEFILEAVAQDLKITVEPAEIEAVIGKEPDKQKQEALKQQSYILASVMRRDKTLAKLLTL